MPKDLRKIMLQVIGVNVKPEWLVNGINSPSFGRVDLQPRTTSKSMSKPSSTTQSLAAPRTHQRCYNKGVDWITTRFCIVTRTPD